MKKKWRFGYELRHTLWAQEQTRSHGICVLFGLRPQHERKRGLWTDRALPAHPDGPGEGAALGR